MIEQNKNKPLQLKAERYARMMEKRLDIVDNTFGLSNDAVVPRWRLV